MKQSGCMQIAATLTGAAAMIALIFFAAAPVIDAAPQTAVPPASRVQPTPGRVAPPPGLSAASSDLPSSNTIRLPGFGAEDSAKFQRIKDARASAAMTYSGRPLVAVGTLEELNLTSMSLKMKVDPDASAMPDALRVTAKRIGTTEQLRNSEFTPERTFTLSSSVLYIDGRPSPEKPQMRASTGRINEDKQRMKPSEFAAGDRISVLYRRATNASEEAHVLTVAKVDPNAKNFDVDSNPLGPNSRVQRTTRSSTNQSTQTVIMAPGTPMPKARPVKTPAPSGAPSAQH